LRLQDRNFNLLKTKKKEEKKVLQPSKTRVSFVTVQGNGMEHQRAAVARQSHFQVQHTQQAHPQQQM